MIRDVKRSFVSIIVENPNMSAVLKNFKVARSLAIFILSALVLAGMAGTGAAVSGMVAEWHFDGSAQDTSGSGNNGTINGAAFVQGISGQALSFDGVDDMVVVPHSSSLSLEKYTLEAWIKKDQHSEFGVHNAIISKRYEPSWMDNYGLYISVNGTVQASSYSPDIWTWFGVGSVKKISAGDWYHIAATYDRAILKIYINGVLDNSVNYQYIPYLNNQQLVIGRGCDGDPCMFRPSIPSFNGIIDEVRLYNRALSASEIQAEYNALTSTPTPTPAPTVTVSPPPATTSPQPLATSPPAKDAKFRVGPSVTLRPVTDVIEANQDGIVELFMNNPSLNDVTLNVDARVSVPSGIHVYGESFGQAAGAGVVAGTFSIPSGTSRIITLVIKADKSARIGSHTIQFTGLYYPGDNKDAYNPLSLTYSVTVKEPSQKPEEPPKEVQATANPSITPGFGVILAIFGVFAIARLLSRK